MLISSNKNNIKKGKEAGFTLLELLLSVSVAAILLLGITALLQNVARNELAANAADHIAQVGEAVEAILQEEEFFDVLHARAVAPGFTAANIYEFPFNFLTAGNDFGGGVVLEPSSTLGQNFNIRSPLKTDITILLEVADTAPSARALNVVVVTDDAVAKDMVIKTAREVGAKGGYLFDDPIIAINDPLQGAFGIWRVEFADLAGSPWHTSVTGAGLSADEGYLAYYSYVNEEDVLGDYLYRTPQFTRPDLHRMQANLNMGNYNLEGADNVYVSGDMTVSQDVIVQGALAVLGDTIFDGDFAVDGGRVRAQNMGVGNTTLTPAARTTYGVDGSQIVVQDQLTIANNADVALARANDVTTAGLNAETIEVDNVNVNGGDVEVNSVSGLAATVINNAGDLNLQNEVQANRLLLSNGGGVAYSQATSDLGVITFNGGDVEVTGGLSAPRIDNAGNTDFDRFGTCDDGCVEIF